MRSVGHCDDPSGSPIRATSSSMARLHPPVSMQPIFAKTIWLRATRCITRDESVGLNAFYVSTASRYSGLAMADIRQPGDPVADIFFGGATKAQAQLVAPCFWIR